MDWSKVPLEADDEGGPLSPRRVLSARRARRGGGQLPESRYRLPQRGGPPFTEKSGLPSFASETSVEGWGIAKAIVIWYQHLGLEG